MKIGYVGPFGDSNFGDYAMAVNDILDINEKEITLFTYDDSFIKELQVEYLNDFNINVCKIETKNQIKIETSNKYKVEYNNYSDTPLELLKEVSNIEIIKNEIEKIDKLVIVGGGYFNHIWNAKHRRNKLISIFTPIIIATQLSKKIVFLGNTYGPFDESSEMFSNIINYLKNPIVASRDDLYSPSNLRKIGFDGKINILPDDLYFINNSITCGYENKRKKYIILELYYSINELQENKKSIIEFINQMEAKYNYKVYFLPFDKEYGGENQAKEIKRMNNKIEIFEINNNKFQKISEILEIVKNAEFILCNRYHLFLLAIANNVPAVQILKDVCGDKRYYYCKSNGLLRQVFSNQYYEESLFFTINLTQATEKITNNLDEIISNQKKLFNDTKAINEKKMKEKRTNYINKYIKE